MMPDSKSPAERYRRLARECFETARTVQNTEARAALLEMAQVWMRLAAMRKAARRDRPPQLAAWSCGGKGGHHCATRWPMSTPWSYAHDPC
jgi:hypothetical protein